MDRRAFLVSSTLALTGMRLFPHAMLADGKESDTPPKNDEIRDYLNRMKHFDAHFPSDVLIAPNEGSLLASCVGKLKQVEQIVGYSRFTVIPFALALAIARNYSQAEPFSRRELDFLERIFYSDARAYGFLGKRTLHRLDHEIEGRDIQKVSGTAHFLYRGRALETYQKVKGEMGAELVLTSGVRGVVKQMLLFLNKAHNNRGNLSLASRQLAPPGYSFHGIGDLDVGKAGFGAQNFTERFMMTDVFRRLSQRGYLSLRYPQNNLLGVRYEPWHIKVVDWI